MFLTCLAMTGEERVTSYEIIIPAFTRFTMTKKEKNYTSSRTYNTFATVDILSIIGSFSTSCLWKEHPRFCQYELLPLSLRGTLFFCHCEERSDEAISSNSTHSIFHCICYTVYTYYAGNRIRGCHSLLTQK